jgi:hypothetical protein
MEDLRSRVEYLKGLADGLGLDTASKEGKMITEMLRVVGDIAEGLTGLASDQEDIEAYLDVVDSDLQDLEEDVYGTEEYEEDDDEEEAGIDQTLDDYETAEAGELGPAEPYTCPSCGEPVHTSDPGVARHEGQLGSGGPVALMLTCPRCGTAFHVAQPDLLTGVRPEDEMTDLPYPTKE